MGWHYLDLVDYLLIAEGVVRIPAEQLAHLDRLGLAESALNSPAAGFGGVEAYPEFEEKAAVLCWHLVKNHPLPDGNKRAGFVALLEFCARNGRPWRRGDDDPAATDEIIRGVAAGTVDVDQLKAWIAERAPGGAVSGQQQFEFFGGPEEEQPDIPLVYLAMPLSHLDKREREHVQLLAHTVTRALDDASQRAAPDPWRVAVHSPAQRSAPWQDDHYTPDEIYRLNSRTVWEDADALVVIGYDGGSLGSGQELAWAASLALPTLYVHNVDTGVSRQLRGAAREHDLTIASHRSPNELSDLVERWLSSRRHLIADGPRRRRNRGLLFAETQTRLRSAWEALSQAEQKHVVHVTRIARDRIVRLLDSVGAFSQASMSEISSLAAAVQVDRTNLAGVGPLPDLRGEQKAALVNAAEEFGWDVGETFRLYDAARVELARGGTRRLPLASPYDWRVFNERLGSGY